MNIVVHPTTRTALDSLVARPAHAILLSGSQGIGKTHLARQLAVRLLGSDIASGNNPYYRELTPVKNTITIEQIRELTKFFQLSVPGTQAVKRVALLVDAETMGGEAQNALLKLLEEPPEGSVLILTSSHPTGLLPTIRSRVQPTHVISPSTDQIAEYFQAEAYDAAAVERAILRHAGNIAAIQSALDGVAAVDPVLDLVKQALGGSGYDRMLLVDGLVKQKEQAVEFVSTLAAVATVSLRAAARKGGVLTRWHAILQSAYTAQEALQRSGNTKLVLTELMLAL